MVQEIQRRLDEIEQHEDVVICLAVESGSRAWGFASRDSDWDVRFLYVHRPAWYLSVDDRRRDVIERPIVDDLDVSGWDLPKALRLFRRSNPPLLEWLGSPIVYRERTGLAPRLRALAAGHHTPRSGWGHYAHMAQGNLREYLRGDIVWRKKYFYVLRPLLAMRWIERGLGPVPTEFDRLVTACADEPGLRAAIEALLAQKRDGDELDRGPRDPVLGPFIEAEMARVETLEPPVDGPGPAPTGALDAVFLETLREAWGTPVIP